MKHRQAAYYSGHHRRVGSLFWDHLLFNGKLSETQYIRTPKLEKHYFTLFHTTVDRSDDTVRKMDGSSPRHVNKAQQIPQGGTIPPPIRSKRLAFENRSLTTLDRRRSLGFLQLHSRGGCFKLGPSEVHTTNTSFKS